MVFRLKIASGPLVKWARRQKQIPKEIRAAAVRSLNMVGRKALDDVVQKLAEESGLAPSTVRRSFTIELATASKLSFSIQGSRELFVSKSRRPMEGRSFAKRPESYFREGELVNIVTMGDDRVCPLCEALAEGSPYTIEEARAQIPHHVNCRCAVEPARSGGVEGRGHVARSEFRPAIPGLLPTKTASLQQLSDAMAREMKVIIRAV